MNGNEANSDEGLLAGYHAVKPPQDSGAYWAGWHLISLPFYLVGTALFLFGGLSPDFHFPENGEPAGLFCIFSTLQIYGILLLIVGWQDEKDRRILPENHYGGHMDGACGCVDACGWNHFWVGGSIHRRDGAAACGLAWLVTGRQKTLIMPAGAVLSFLAAPVNFMRRKPKLPWQDWAANGRQPPARFEKRRWLCEKFIGMALTRRKWKKTVPRGRGRRESLRRTLA